MALLTEKDITVSILRLDRLHPVISGNKIFKLKYYLQDALAQIKSIKTFGGPYSNHLAATAAACFKARIPSIGIVRGEHDHLSHTLKFCLQHDMKLKFISREEYREVAGTEDFDDDQNIIIPEGGFGKNGVKGSAEIGLLFDASIYSHVCCPVGTATTLAGLISSAPPSQKVIGFSALERNALKSITRFVLSEKDN